MPKDTFSTISQILEQKFHTPVILIKHETALSDLGLDSLTLMEFVFAVEDSFGLRIPEEKLDPRQVGITLINLCSVIDEIQENSASAH
jgi:acyl carrier protein